jgi:VanZ family protein
VVWRSTGMVKAACICTLCVIFVAGLWPFRVPKNDVSWLTHEDGLYFGRHGSALSVGSFPARLDKVSGTIEIWLQPSLASGAHTILSFDSSAHRGAPFLLLQFDNSLIIQQDNEDTNGNSWTAWSVVSGVLRRGKPVFASIVLGPRHTAVYIDGVLYRDFSIGDSWNNLTGRLVVANSAHSNDSWSGKIKAIALYNRELPQSEVLEHYESSTKANGPDLALDQAPIALYRFNEHSGDTVHNQFDHGTDLKIPKSYFVLHAPLLELPWRTYHSSWSYWKDVALNIVGFIPLGLFVTAYYSSLQKLKGAAAIAVGLGFLTSLLIETLQAFLPTRDSGLNDVITNTLGTALGALLYSVICRVAWCTTQSDGLLD